MLTRLHKILIALLALQAGLVILVLTRRDDTTARKPEPVIAGFDAANVTKLTVYDKDGTSPAVVLAKQGDRWVVGSSFDYPVADTKIGDLLASIAKLSAGSPIATQASRHKQLRVDDAAFERKLVITAGGDTTLLLGAQAGQRRTAVRRGGDAHVYAVGGLNVWSIGTEPRDWVDTGYVKLGAEEVEKVIIEREGTRTELERDGDGWKLIVGGAPIKTAAGEEFDRDAIQRIVGSAASIELRAPGDPKRDASKPTATMTIVRKAQAGGATASGSPVVLDIIADGESYWVRDRASPHAILVDKSRLADVVELTRDQLVKKASPAPKPAPPGGAPSDLGDPG